MLDILIEGQELEQQAGERCVQSTFISVIIPSRVPTGRGSRGIPSPFSHMLNMPAKFPLLYMPLNLFHSRWI